MAEINLLQPQRKSEMSLPKIKLSGMFPVWILSGIFVLELAAWGGLVFYRSAADAKNNDIQTQTDQLDKKIAAVKGSLVPIVQAQGAISSLKDLLDNHIHWSRVWEELGRVTLKTVTFTGVSATTAKNEFLLDGTVSDFSTLGKLLLGLNTSDNFENVTLVSTSISDKDEKVEVGFKISVTAKPGLFLVKNSPPSSGENN